MKKINKLIEKWFLLKKFLTVEKMVIIEIMDDNKVATHLINVNKFEFENILENLK